MHILLDIRALCKVEDLSLYHIPTQCNHSDILKNIMANCSILLFTRVFSHVKAHQDDSKKYGNLTSDAQLNCQMDYLAKSAIYATPNTQSNQTKCFSLKSLCVLLGNNKVTLDKGDRLRLWVHKQSARTRFHKVKAIFTDQFDWIEWKILQLALCRVPKMIQIWAWKQVMDITPANRNRPWERSLGPHCPSCAQVPETCSHILFYNHSGRVDSLMNFFDLLNTWMAEVVTDPDFWDCMVVEYFKGRGGDRMEEIFWGMDTRFCWMVANQDIIGWRRFMEGMVCKGLREIQSTYSAVNGSNVSPEQWTTGVVIKLLKATLGQWLYCCIQIHDRIKGTQAT